jgi:hypothetical protein
MIVSIPGGSSGGGGGGGGSVTSGTLATTTIETTGAFSVPAGASWIEIRNAGMVQPGDLEASATVAGQSWSPGRVERWNAVLDSALGEYKRLPAVAGNGNGSRLFISYGV